MLIDLHNHSWPLSGDSSIRPEVLVDFAKKRGLDGICLTEHNAAPQSSKMQALSDQHEILVLPGMEIGTDIGHVLVFGLRQYTPGMGRALELQKLVDAEGGAMILAHPLRGSGAAMGDLKISFDAFEVLNGSESATSNSGARQWATSLGLPGTGGSDAHSIREIGKCATKFIGNIRHTTDLIAALQAGTFEAILM